MLYTCGRQVYPDQIIGLLVLLQFIAIRRDKNCIMLYSYLQELRLLEKKNNLGINVYEENSRLVLLSEMH